MNTFSLRIVACNRVFYDGECEALIFPGYDGQMEILAHHEQMTTMVKIGEIRYKLPQCDWQKAVVSDGLIQVEHNHVNVIVYSAEKPEEMRAQCKREYEDRFLNPYVASARGYVNEVIKPEETRLRILQALQAMRHKKAEPVKKKHGNIPL